jgi:hypothetical protein
MALVLAATVATVTVSPPAGLQTGASRVTLATVTDTKNQPFVDAGPDDFVIQEAGTPREILSVRVADYPVVVMLDCAGESTDDFSQARTAVNRFIERLGPRPVAVGLLCDPPTMVTTFGTDRQTVAQRLSAVSTDPRARSQMLQGASLGGRVIQAVSPLFSALVLISATPSDDSRGSLEDLVGPIVDSRAVVHLVAHRSFGAPGGNPEIGKTTEVLKALAEQTRGGFTPIYSSASYQAALDRLAARLTSELLIEYLVPVGSTASDVKIGIRLPGATVRGLGVGPR